jgi:polyphosphate kinase
VPYNPRFPERIRDHAGDCFAAIRQKDLIVHHPYESFDAVVQFLAAGARSGRHRHQADALSHLQGQPDRSRAGRGGRAGKSVTAVVELKARFDEEANIALGARLERAAPRWSMASSSSRPTKLSQVVRREAGAGVLTSMSAPATIIR